VSCSEQAGSLKHSIQCGCCGPRNRDVQTTNNSQAAIPKPAEDLQLAPCVCGIDVVPGLRLADGDFAGPWGYATHVRAPFSKFEWRWKTIPKTTLRNGAIASDEKVTICDHLANRPEHKSLVYSRRRHVQFPRTRSTASRIRESSSLRPPKISFRSTLPLSSISSVTVINSRRFRVRSTRA
jgi:hypothetical protein